MGYKEKIQLLENQIKELDKDIEQMNAVYRESLTAYSTLRNSISKRPFIEKLEITFPLLKQANLNAIELFRLQSNKIRKISVELSDKLNEQILDYESELKLFSISVQNHIEKPNEDKFSSEFDLRLGNITSILSKLDNRIKIIESTIKAVIEKFKD